MKRFCILLSIILFLFSFSGCSKAGGNVSNVEIVSVESVIYSQDEILDAIEVVKTEFLGFTGCTLTKIGYVGDQEIYNTVLTEDALNNPPWIALDCEFTTSESSASEGFNANETYEYGIWEWYLEKDAFGNWKVKNDGVA